MSGAHQEPGSGVPHHGAAPRSVTIKDVAARAGVAQGTVSNVLNNPELVRAPTRRRVEEAIAELGYLRNESARLLRMGTSRTIALVVPDIANPFFDDVAAGADDAADAADAMVVVCSSANSATREERHLRRLDGQRLLGVAITPLHEPPWQLLEDITAHGTPVVFIDFVPASSRAAVGVGPSTVTAATAAVTVDDHLGGFLAGQHLLEAGHQRITFLAPVFQQTQDRLAGLREAVGDQGRIDVVRCAAMTIDAGARAAGEVLSGPHDSRPTAVFCGNDLIAVGVLGEFHRRGVRVPEEVALVGFDDVDIAAHMSVPITTIRQPRHLLGARAVRMLLGEAVGERLSVFQPDLVVRASSPAVWMAQQPR